MVDEYDYIRQNPDIKEYARKINRMQTRIKQLERKIQNFRDLDVSDTRQKSERIPDHTHKGQISSAVSSAVSNAVQLTSSGQFDDVTDVTPATGDEFLIEDASDTQNKKSVTFDALEAGLDLANLGSKAHSALTGIGANDHHTKYTDEEVDDRVNALLVAGNNLTKTYDDVANALTFDVDTLTEADISDLDHYVSADFDTDFGGKSTSDLSEGTNLYFTNTRADTRADLRIAVASVGDLSDVDLTGLADNDYLIYNSATGNFEPTATTNDYVDADVESYLESQGFDPSGLKFTADLNLNGNSIVNGTSTIIDASGNLRIINAIKNSGGVAIITNPSGTNLQFGGNLNLTGNDLNNGGNGNFETLDVGTDLFQVAATGELFASSMDTGSGGSSVQWNAVNDELFVSSSSIQFKTDLRQLTYDRDAFYNMSAYNYEEIDSKNRYAGLIAEDVATINELLSVYDRDGVIMNYDERGLIAVMFEEIKSLNDRINVLEGGA